MQICWKNGFADQWLSPRNSGAKYDSNKMLRWFQNFSVCLSNVLAKIPAKDSRDTLAYYVRNGFDMPQHFAKDYDLVFNQLRLLVLPNYIVYLQHTWTGETENTISLVDHLVLVSSCVLVIAEKHITQR